MLKLKRLIGAGLLAAAVVQLYGCGIECGPRTIEQDGQCVLVDSGCGSGTVLEDGRCVTDNSGCGVGTRLDGPECVPAETSCGSDTTFDQVLEVCVPNTDIVCGESTLADDRGVCVPSGETCADMATLGADGRCVIEAAACGEGTALDPQTGECVLAGAACEDGFALDADSGECTPTDAVCGPATSFDDASGLCLPDACQQGDVLTNGVCMSPIEEMAYNADLTESENNDPAAGGTADTLTVDSNGGEFTFAGTISEPTDLDGDGAVDQDLDAFAFEAHAGDWLQLGVQSNGLQAPGFVVRGPNDYVRWSEITLASESARHLVIPEDGTYTVTILPSLKLQNPDMGPSGHPEWGYVGTIRAIEPPSPDHADVSGDAVALSGQFDDLSDNSFALTGVSAGDLLSFTVEDAPPHAEGVLQVWEDPSTLYASRTLNGGDEILVGVPPTEEAVVLVDWTKLYGASHSFAILAEITGEQRQLSVPAGGADSATIQLAQFEQLVVSQTNAGDQALDVTIADDSDTIIASQTLAAGDELAAVAFSDGDYTVEVTNNATSDVSAAVDLNINPPVDLGTIVDGSSTAPPASDLSSNDKAYYTFSTSSGQIVSFSHDNGEAGPIDYVIYDATGAEIDAGTDVSARSNRLEFDFTDVVWNHFSNDATYLIEVTAAADAPGHTLDVRGQVPADIGTLDSDTSVIEESTAALERGYSDFYWLETTETASYYGALSARAGESVGFSVYDAELASVDGAFGAGEVSLGGTLHHPGRYLVRIIANESLSGYDMTLHGLTAREDLSRIEPGDSQSVSVQEFAFGQTLRLTFDIPEGDVIEISHENADAADQGVALYDARGTVIDQQAPFEARSSAQPDYLYQYAPDGGQFEVLLQGWSPTSDQMLTVRAVSPEHIGQLGETTARGISEDGPKGRGQAYFKKIEFTEALTFDAMLAPANGEALDFEMIDSSNHPVVSVDGDGGEVGVSGESLVFADTYLVRIDANEDATGFELAFDNAISLQEDLGSVRSGSGETSSTLTSFGAGEGRVYTFSVPANQLIGLAHDNDEAAGHHMTLYGPDGDVLVETANFQPSAGATVEQPRWFAEDGGTYTVVLEAGDDASNQILAVDLWEPTDLGALPLDTTVSEASAGALGEGHADYYLIEFADDGYLSAQAVVPNAEDINLHLYDLEMNQVAGDMRETPADLGPTAINAGTFLIRISAVDAVSTYDLEISLEAPLDEPDFASAPNLAIPDGDNMMGSAPGDTAIDVVTATDSCTSIATVSVYVDISHQTRGDLAVDLVAPSGARVKLQDWSFSSEADLVGWYPTELTAEGTGTLAEFDGEEANGDWRLEVTDYFASDRGTLNQWGLTFTCE